MVGYAEPTYHVLLNQCHECSIGYLPNRSGVTDTLIIWNHFATVMNFSFLLQIGENAHTQRSPAPSQPTPQPTRPELTWWSFSFYQKTSKVPHQTLFTAKTSEWQKGQIWQSSGCCGADSQIYKCQVQLEAAKKLSSKSPSPLAGSCTNFRASSTSDIHSFSREMRQRRWYFCISSRKGLFLSSALLLYWMAGPLPPAEASGFLRTRMTESPLRNIFGMYRSLFTGFDFFLPGRKQWNELELELIYPVSSDHPYKSLSFH